MTQTPEPAPNNDLIERLHRAIGRLEENRDKPRQSEREKTRLGGKIEGVKLALSYLGEQTFLAGEPEVPTMTAPSDLDEYDVAAVVFCRTRAGDEADAGDRAALAVRHTLTDHGSPTPMPLEIYLPEHLKQRGFTSPVQVAGVTPLRYVGGQGIRLVATAEPYQDAGMGKPRKAQG